MSIIPTWPFVAGALVIGLAGGAYIDHKVMQGRIDKISISHTEELRVREVKRAEDERAARVKEQSLAARVGEIEQEKLHAIQTANADADALIARLRNQATSKPTNSSSMSRPAPSCETPIGRELLERSREATVQLAQRADGVRAALGACYQAYDSIGAAR